MVRAWILPTLLVLCGSAVATVLAFEGNPGAAAALLLAFRALAGVNSPLVFPRSISAREAQRRSVVDGRPVVFVEQFIRALQLLADPDRQLLPPGVLDDPLGVHRARQRDFAPSGIPVFPGVRLHVRPVPDVT
ncbi:hypothetical protein ACQ4WX_48545 [Streptomyces lasalocidi]